MYKSVACVQTHIGEGREGTSVYKLPVCTNCRDIEWFLEKRRSRKHFGPISKSRPVWVILRLGDLNLPFFTPYCQILVTVRDLWRRGGERLGPGMRFEKGLRCSRESCSFLTSSFSINFVVPFPRPL